MSICFRQFLRCLALLERAHCQCSGLGSLEQQFPTRELVACKGGIMQRGGLLVVAQGSGSAMTQQELHGLPQYSEITRRETTQCSETAARGLLVKLCQFPRC